MNCSIICLCQKGKILLAQNLLWPVIDWWATVTWWWSVAKFLKLHDEWPSLDDDLLLNSKKVLVAAATWWLVATSRGYGARFRSNFFDTTIPTHIVGTLPQFRTLTLINRAKPVHIAVAIFASIDASTRHIALGTLWIHFIKYTYLFFLMFCLLHSLGDREYDGVTTFTILSSNTKIIQSNCVTM